MFWAITEAVVRWGSRKTGLIPPQYFNTDHSKVVLLLWFLTVTWWCSNQIWRLGPLDNTLGTTWSPASSLYVHVSCLSLRRPVLCWLKALTIWLHLGWYFKAFRSRKGRKRFVHAPAAWIATTSRSPRPSHNHLSPEKWPLRSLFFGLI